MQLEENQPSAPELRPRSTSQRTRIMLLVLLMTAALTVQIPAMVKVHTVEYDEAIFLDVARNVQRIGLPIRSIGKEGAFFFDHTSLYIYLLSLYATPATDVFFLRLVTTIFSSGCVILVFLIGERIGGTCAGTTAALLLALNPFFAVYAFFIRMEIPMAFSMLLGLWLITKWEQGRAESLLIEAGLALAFAALFKEFALLFTLVCTAHVLYKCLQRGMPIWKPLSYTLVPTIIGISLWGIWCWSLSPSAFNNALNRWINSATVQDVGDPRLGVATGEWIHKIIFDLLGIVITIGIVTSLGLVLIRKKRSSIMHPILAVYPAAAIGISFVIQLKELRHIIGVIPIAALLIGTSVNRQQVLAWSKSTRRKKYALAASAVLCLLLASPFRIPTQNPASIEAWLNPIYAYRVLHNDSYYNVLRLAGIYVQEHTTLEDVITIAHEGPVVAYYADRHYRMLYTLPFEYVLQTLEQTDYLVWDHTLFLDLTNEQTEAVQDYVGKHFRIETTIQDNYRRVEIYRRIVTSD
jgi:4-amino-4-deoxy-L-arabinose transferase-like glycosyltransferase